ncbi:MAG: winged helix-turn-helix transcriptional regulator [Pirellulales bacterium]
MSTTTETSDATILDLLRQDDGLSVAQLADKTGVTATAVRQRLNRLMGQGLIERRVQRAARGRPSHQYLLTEKGLRTAGTNYGDLAMTLWEEIRAIEDPEVRRGLLARIAEHMARAYAGQISGDSIHEKMESVAHLFGERGIPLKVDVSGELPVLTALACPYPELAEKDRSVCAMERMMFSELLGSGVRLSDCRLDGASCCTFEVH